MARLAIIASREKPRERIALSFVHARGCIDVSVREVLEVEAIEEQIFLMGSGARTIPVPQVSVSLAPRVRAQLHRLTCKIVGQELPILIAGKTVSRPIVQEPLGTHHIFWIKVWDMGEASELVTQLRSGWIRPDLQVM